MLRRMIITDIQLIIYMIKSRRQHLAGFTLVELLVVIGIILIASSVILLNTSSDLGSALSASQRIVSGIAQGARGQAILKGATTRLIIYSNSRDNSDDDKKLRFFGIIYEDGSNAGNWYAATQGNYLPDGIFFDPTTSKSNANSSEPGSTMNIEYPRLKSQPLGGDEYYYYEFNSNGTVAVDFQNAWLVLRAGVLKPSSDGSDNLEVNFKDRQLKGLKSALILRRSGTTTKVNDPELIEVKDDE
ncbi:MAG: prepilin-type N-terminal cleavage/methylation domain-containing protein [Verrucomicrobiota bacterium]|nr:prepilin-type N-terminal cleavage/methylation domain-containing protein [Verrucomicrobiota bacterium]